jgi:nucleoid-associated protein YgaU
VIAAVIGGFAIERQLGRNVPAAQGPRSASQAPRSASLAPAPAAAPAPIAPKPNPAVRGPEPAPKTAAAPAPEFDVVRVESSGDAVVAGHAAPGAKVELRDEKKVIASITADDSGQFVILPEPLTAGPHHLRLAARVGDGEVRLSGLAEIEVAARKIPSPPSAVAAAPPVAKPQPAAPGPARVAARVEQPVPSTPLASGPTTSNPGAAAIVPSTPRAAAIVPPPIPTATPLPNPPIASPVAIPSPQPAAIPSPPPIAAVVSAEPDAKSAAPPAPGPAPAGEARLAVSSVKAAEPGRLEAEGYAEPGKRLRLTLNGAYLAEVTAGLDGLWSLTIEHGMTAGLYMLEALQLDPAEGPRAQASFTYPQNSPPAAAPLVSLAPPSRSPVEPRSAAPEPSPDAASAPSASEPTPAAPSAAGAGLIAASPPAPLSPAPKSPEAAPAFPAAGSSAPPEQAARPSVAAAPSTPPPAAVAVSTPTVSTPSHAVVVDVRTTMVVRGDNLWDLARRFYGNGLRYADIYSANAARIRNPNLIYIGQVFVLPQDASGRP